GRGRDPLALTSGEFVRETVQVFRPQSHLLQLLRAEFVRLLSSRNPIHDEGLCEDVLDQHPGIQRRERVLEDGLQKSTERFHRATTKPTHGVAPDEVAGVSVVPGIGSALTPNSLVVLLRDVAEDVSLRRFDQSEEESAERGLPTTALAHERHGFPTVDREVDTIEGVDIRHGPLEKSSLDGEVLREAAGGQQDLVPIVTEPGRSPPPCRTDGKRPTDSAFARGASVPRPGIVRTP